MRDSMQVMGTNTWDFDTDEDMLVKSALEFADMVRQQGVAELLDAWIAEDAKLMWCTWETKDVDGLQRAFDEMNSQSGLTSRLTPIHEMYHAA